MKSAEQELNEQKIKSLVASSYDIQNLRISVGNRIVASFNAQLGIHQNTTSSENTEEAEKETMKTLALISKEFDKITEAYVANRQTIRAFFKKNDPGLTYIKTEADYKLVEIWKELTPTERHINKLLKTEVHKHPMWDAFFSGVVGCGEQMAAVIISNFDIAVARHPSCFWAYAGLDVVNGKGRNRSASMQVEREYVNTEGKVTKTKGLSYNPFVKSKMLGVLAPSFLKKPGCHYEQVYRDYRARLEQREDLDGATARKHKMALRYCVKMFLRDMWVVWRKLERYQVKTPEYEVQFLGHEPHGYNAAFDSEVTQQEQGNQQTLLNKRIVKYRMDKVNRKK